LVALGTSGCAGHPDGHGARTRVVAAQTSPPAAAATPDKRALSEVVRPNRSSGLLLLRGVAAFPIAYSDPFLVWETAGEENDSVALLERNVRTGAIRELARNPFPDYGLVATANAVVYAAYAGAKYELVAIAANGRQRSILSRALIAPFDARGDVVAWAEGDQTRQRVVVRNMKTGSQFVAMQMARCRHGRCYRIDRVIVARDGIVFDLGAVSQGYPSLIVRRRRDATSVTVAKVQNDPQPDLVRSSEGALYYQFQRGWMRWEFGDSRPRLTQFHGTSPFILDDERGRLLLLAEQNCKQRLAVRLPGGRTIHVPAPASTPISTPRFGPLCRQLTGYAWGRKRLLVAWQLIPSVSVESHEEIGSAAIVTAARIP
jgi:hypothetical protein